MKAFRLPVRGRQPRGFTLIELLVVITIIGILASMILPGVQNVRANARKVECLNNMRNVGLAAVAYASNNNGRLPALTQPGTGAIMNMYDAGGSASLRPAPWTVMLFPQLDNTGLYDRLLADPANRPAGDLIGALLSTRIPVFSCPSDLNKDDPGALSYVVNGGYMCNQWWDDATNNNTAVNNHGITGYDYPFDGTGTVTPADQQTTRATGVFFRGQSNTLDGLRDGTSQTVMISENTDVRTYTAGGGWSSFSHGDLSFALRVAGNVTAPVCLVSDVATDVNGLGDLTATNLRGNSLVLAAPYSLGATGYPVSRINGNLNAVAEGEAPRPSSLHPQVVNTIFADGSGKNLSQDIDDSVYARLISSDGNRLGQQILSGY